MSETKVWDDPRVRRGMQRQLELRRARLAAGDKSLGWKVGFGAPAMLKAARHCRAAHRLPHTERARAIRRQRVAQGLGEAGGGAGDRRAYRPRCARGADRAAAAAAIAGISPAIELVDVHTPPQGPEFILGENIYQRHVVLGGSGPHRAGASANGLTCRVMRHGKEFARTTDPQANTGQWIEIVRHVADVLAAFDATLRAGEIIITGSVVPPLTLEPAEAGIAFEVDPIGGVAVRFEY